VSRLHDYTNFVGGRDYVLDISNSGLEHKEYYMTGYGRGIKQCDYILLKSACGVAKYKVKQVEYYHNPPDLWIALLTHCLETI
jgi:hypothetical protein